MSADGSGAMFDRIAPRYDLLNRMMSLGLDHGWRRELCRRLQPSEGEVLDVATGTAEVAIAVARHYPAVNVVGVDPSQQMLALGRDKVRAAGLGGRVDLEVGDAQALRFADHRFAASCIAFGIRNIPDRARALREMARVTRPGGRVALLELALPDHGLLGPLARMYVQHLVPRLGAWLSGAAEYQYLRRSIAAFPPPAKLAAVMTAAGLRVESITRLGLGSAHLFLATRADLSGGCSSAVPLRSACDAPRTTFAFRHGAHLPARMSGGISSRARATRRAVVVNRRSHRQR